LKKIELTAEQLTMGAGKSTVILKSHGHMRMTEDGSYLKSVLIGLQAAFAFLPSELFNLVIKPLVINVGNLISDVLEGLLNIILNAGGALKSGFSGRLDAASSTEVVDVYVDSEGNIYMEDEVSLEDS